MKKYVYYMKISKLKNLNVYTNNVTVYCMLFQEKYNSVNTLKTNLNLYTINHYLGMFLIQLMQVLKCILK